MERYVIGKDFNTGDWWVWDDRLQRYACKCDTFDQAEQFVYSLTGVHYPSEGLGK